VSGAAVKSLCVAVALIIPLAPAQAQAAPNGARQRELVHMVRQDCGSCHGMRLTGGLGPALDAQRLASWPLDALVATIQQGRPGTAMPGWSRFLSAEEAQWIARQLQQGFPQEAP